MYSRSLRRAEQSLSLRELYLNNAVFKGLQPSMLAIKTQYPQAQAQIRLQDYLLDQLGNAVVATDLDGKIIYWNDFAQKLYQWKKAEVKGKNIGETIVANQSRQMVEGIFNNLAQSQVWKGELVLERQDCKQFVADATFTLLADTHGKEMGFIGIFADATERKQAEIALKQSEANLKAIFDSSLQTFMLIDRQYKIQSFNQAANDLYKKINQRNIHQGECILNCISSEYKKEFRYKFKSALKGKAVKIEKAFTGIDGNCNWYEFNYSPVFDDQGKVVGVCQVGININHQKKIIDEVAKSEARFRSLVQNSSDIIIVLQPDGAITYSSDSIERILGYQPKNIIGDNIFDYIHPEDIITAQIKFADTLTKPGVLVLTELRVLHANGSWVYVETATNNLLDEESIKGVVINCRDITERKQAEVILKQQREKERLMNAIAQRIRQSLKLEEILSTTVEEVRQFLQADRVLIHRFQPEWSGLMKVEVESVAEGWLPIKGKKVTDDCFVENHLQSYKQGRIGVIEDIDTANISPCHRDLLAQFQVRANMIVPILDGEKLWGLLIVHQCNNSRQWQEFEIDLLKQLSTQVAIAIQQAQLYEKLSALNADLEKQVQERTSEMEQKLQDLQKLNQLKDDFLSTVSHELRTPLANMKMAIQMVKLAPTPERRQRYVEILQSECNRETDLINDLLDLQRLEASCASISLEPINLQTWLTNIVEPFYSRAQDNQQNLQIHLPAHLPPLISDRNSLERILAELLNNACKYTSPNGEIIIAVERKSTEEVSNAIPSITFTISNQAEIPTTELPRIFDKFYRVPNGDRWKRGGTGLGLALVQKMVEKLEGKIQVESKEQWTSFIITLPINPSPEVMATGTRVLV